MHLGKCAGGGAQARTNELRASSAFSDLYSWTNATVTTMVMAWGGGTAVRPARRSWEIASGGRRAEGERWRALTSAMLNASSYCRIKRLMRAEHSSRTISGSLNCREGDEVRRDSSSTERGGAQRPGRRWPPRQAWCQHGGQSPDGAMGAERTRDAMVSRG